MVDYYIGCLGSGNIFLLFMLCKCNWICGKLQIDCSKLSPKVTTTYYQNPTKWIVYLLHDIYIFINLVFDINICSFVIVLYLIIIFLSSVLLNHILCNASQLVEHVFWLVSNDYCYEKLLKTVVCICMYGSCECMCVLLVT
jgi:hypothetical protein